MLSLCTLTGPVDAVRQKLAFSLGADGSLLGCCPGEDAEKLGELEGRRLILDGQPLATLLFAAGEGDGCKLWLGERLRHSSGRGFRLEIHADPSGMSLVDLNGNEAVYHSYGSVWRPYAQEDKQRPELAGSALELRSKHYRSALSVVAGPRLRPSVLASRSY